MKFCPNCRAPIKSPDQKFCFECSLDLQPYRETLPRITQQDYATDIRSKRQEPANLEEPKTVKLNTYTLGVSLENTASQIFEEMGYYVEKRVRYPMPHGRPAEFDLLLTRGKRKRAVECKNYDPSKSVPVSDMHVFHSKLEQTKIISGIFITNTYFSEGAQSMGEALGIELWDRELTMQKFFTHAIGRTRTASLVDAPILPLSMDFTVASSLALRNNQSVRLFSAALLYQPYYIIKYRLEARRNDTTGKVHKFSESGTYHVDALDGDIINSEKDILGNIVGLFKNKEQRLKSKEDKFVSEDLENIEFISKPVLSNSDYKVSSPQPEISEEIATKIVKSHLIEKNKKSVNYSVKVRGEFEMRSFMFVPRLNEVSIRGVQLVYVPKWDLEYEAGQSNFSRRFLGSSGRLLNDDIAKCRKCTLLRKDTVAVCDVCGIPLCEKHLFDEGQLLCENHISEGHKAKVKEKSILSKFRLKR